MASFGLKFHEASLRDIRNSEYFTAEYVVSLTYSLHLRLAEAFRADLTRAVDLIMEMPDTERKQEFIVDMMKSLRSLHTDVTLNTHFIVLSSLLGCHASHGVVFVF